MPRTNIFVSYSHADRSWAERVRLHFAVLERRALVDVWSDQRVQAGSDWEAAIKAALTEAKVAVLIVTPAFFASEFIWKNEMPEILKHEKAGMRTYPLIARPCAWQLDPDLALLQARPADDRALSEGSESDIDLNLSRFVYELATILGIGSESSVETWEGAYESDRPLRLRILKREADQFDGRLEYPEEGRVTIVSGATHVRWSPSEAPWAQLPERSGAWTAATAITIREFEYEKRGKQDIEFGDYHVLQLGNRITGAWFKNGSKFGRIELVKTG